MTTSEQKWEIWRLHLEGMKATTISRITGRKVQEVKKAIEQLEQYETDKREGQNAPSNS